MSPNTFPSGNSQRTEIDRLSDESFDELRDLDQVPAAIESFEDLNEVNKTTKSWSAQTAQDILDSYGQSTACSNYRANQGVDGSVGINERIKHSDENLRNCFDAFAQELHDLAKNHQILSDYQARPSMINRETAPKFRFNSSHPASPSMSNRATAPDYRFNSSHPASPSMSNRATAPKYRLNSSHPANPSVINPSLIDPISLSYRSFNNLTGQEKLDRHNEPKSFSFSSDYRANSNQANSSMSNRATAPDYRANSRFQASPSLIDPTTAPDYKANWRFQASPSLIDSTPLSFNNLTGQEMLNRRNEPKSRFSYPTSKEYHLPWMENQSPKSPIENNCKTRIILEGREEIMASTSSNQANSSTKEVEKKHLDDLVLNVELELKSRIMMNIISCSNLLLSGYSGCKKNLIESTNYLIKKLTLLPSENPHSFFNKDTQEDLFFQMSCKTRRRIIDHLIVNSDALFFSESIVSEDKLNIVEQNNRLIHILENVTSKKIAHFDYNFPKDTEGSECKDGKANDGKEEERAKDDKASDDKDESAKDEPAKDDKANDKRAKVDEANGNKISLTKDKEINDLDEQLKIIDIKSDKTKFSFEVKNVRQFLKTKSCVFSSSFELLGLLWCLQVRSRNLIDGHHYIEFYLWLNDVDLDFSVEATYDLIMFHPKNGDLDRSFKVSNKVFSESDKSCGFKDYISHEELTNFIDSNTIKLGVRVRAKKV